MPRSLVIASSVSAPLPVPTILATSSLTSSTEPEGQMRADVVMALIAVTVVCAIALRWVSQR